MMKMKIINVLLIVMLILVGCAQQEINSEQLDEKEILISNKVIKLEPGKEEQVFIGINNKRDKQIYQVKIECKDCEGVEIQYFPKLDVASNTKAAFPFLIKSNLDTKEGKYEFKLEVKKGEELFSESFEVNVVDEVSNLKEKYN
jgi:uncharacterized membrane protein